MNKRAKKKIAASIEVRMTSSRLPGKVFMESFPGIPMIQFMLERVTKSRLLDDVIVATTTNHEDNVICELCNKLGIKFFRGSEDDVLSRVLDCHKQNETDIIVELTGDCPFIDNYLIDEMVEFFLKNEFDYVSNCHIRKVPVGLDIQVFPTKILERIEKIAKEQVYREHVSNYIYEKSNYRLGVFNSNLIKNDFSNLRITLDTIGDYNLIRKLIKETHGYSNSHIPSYEIVEFYARNIKYRDLLKTKNKIEYEDL